jgi:hypothetical protein
MRAPRRAACTISGTAFDRPPAPTVRGAPLPAAVDDLLRAPLHLGVAALHRVEIEVGEVGAGAHRGGRAAAHADQQPGPAELHDQRAGGLLGLGGLPRIDVADAARQHDRLVVAAHHAAAGGLERAEVAAQVRPPELVVERGRADGPFQHDVERGRDARRAAGIRALPGLRRPGDAQVRHRETDQPGLRLGAPAGGAGKGEIAVGWLCVSHLMTIWVCPSVFR